MAKIYCADVGCAFNNDKGVCTAKKVKLQFVYVSDMVNVVRCKDCVHCFSMESDPLTPYDGESEW